MSELINARITNDEIENYKKLKKAMKGLYLITEKDIADDINDTIINVMKDYKSQTIILNNKLDRETLRRKEAESNLFGLMPEIYCLYQQATKERLDRCKDETCVVNIKYKKAREYKEKYEDK